MRILVVLPETANSGTDSTDVTVGGGHLGHPLAHKNEAPFPLKLAEHFNKGGC